MSRLKNKDEGFFPGGWVNISLLLPKYQNLKNYTVAKDENVSVNIFTLEISVLGLISDFELFQIHNLKEKTPQNVKTKLSRSVLCNSYNIYNILQKKLTQLKHVNSETALI